jgi:serine/threonine protein kinase
VALTTGSRIGPYEIKSPLGEGGMGVVYRAHDTKLGRDVAIKALPDAFASDADRLLRFQREAQVLASLNHPNIAQIYGLEESDKTRCIVMELVEGETLQKRLRRGPIPVDEALPMASQIAAALEAAHEKGIIHRDLKPANIKLTPDGKVKVLDFGLAKAFEPEHSPTLSNSPTLIGTSAQGVILGTAAYMSPEQARGKEADRSSDIWAFGCVLYEMLTGHAAFEGETIGEILAGVFKAEPDWKRLPTETPEAVRRLLRRCLQKDRSERLKSADAVRIEIKEALSAPPAVGPPDAKPTRNPRLAWIVAALAILAFAVLLIRDFNRSEPPEAYLQIVTPPTADATSMAVSPDGRKVVFAGSNQGRTQLFLRALDSVNAQPLPGTEGARYPFWSPNSRSIGFFAPGRIGNVLKRIDVPGGPVQELTSAGAGSGGTWNQDDVILFTRSPISTRILRVAAGGGPVVQVTQLDSPRAARHVFPYFLPDGRHFLFYALGGGPEVQGVYWGDLESKERVRLFYSDSAAVYSPSGYLLFIRQGTLFAQRFDAARRQPIGDPFSVAEQVAFDAPSNIGAISAGAGVLAYRTGSFSSNRQLVWFDRSGKPLGDAAPPDGGSPLNPELSPDGSRVALSRNESGNSDIWVLELARHTRQRFTVDPAVDLGPVWSPNGDRIVFSSARKGSLNLYLMSSSGAGSEDLLLESLLPKLANDWSRDGRFIIYRSLVDPNQGDLWVLPLFGDHRPYPFVATPANEAYAQFSPDGRWVAYYSDKSGQYEIYVQPFPGPGGELLVSNAGGTQPRWNRNGKELFYIAADGKLMSVSVQRTTDGQTFKLGTPVELFATHLVAVVPSAQRQQYAVSPDGQRFLMNVPVENASVSPITVVLNWRGALPARENR